MNSTEDMTYHIFLSYRWGDKKTVTEDVFNSFVKNIETETGLRVFYDEEKLLSGDFVENIRENVRNAYVFMPIVTDSYIKFGPESGRNLKKDYCLLEYLTAINNEIRIVPVFFNCKSSSTGEEFAAPRGAAEHILGLVNRKNKCNYTDEVLSALAAKDDLEEIKRYLVRQNGIRVESLQLKKDAFDQIEKLVFDSFFKKKDKNYFADILDAQRNRLNPIHIFGEFEDRNLTLENTYVPLTLERIPTEKEIKDAQERKKELPRELFEDKELRDRLISDKYAVLVGDAGQGKSLAVKKLCMDLGERTKRLGFSKDEYFPIYYECKSFIQSLNFDEESEENRNDPFERALYEQIGFSRAAFEAVFRNCKPLLIFDAMDEVAVKSMDHLIDKINNHILSKPNRTHAHILFTSRPGQKLIASGGDMMIDKTQRTTVRKYKVQYFDDKQRNEYITKLSFANDEPNKKEIFLEQLNEKENAIKDYTEISRNPFLLFTIFSSYDPRRDTLPKTRFDAVEKAIDSVIKREMDKIPYEWEYITSEEYIKAIMGCLSYRIYKAKDANDRLEINEKLLSECAEEIIENEAEEDRKGFEREFKRFINKSKLYNENGFSHEFFAETYAAYFLWTEVKNNAKATKRNNEESSSDSLNLWLKIKAKSSTIKDFDETNADTEYWKSVKKALLLLSDKYSKESFIAESLIEGFQSTNEPDYDLICDAVSQFEKPHIKERAADLILEKMMDRGCKGILTGSIELVLTRFVDDMWEDHWIKAPSWQSPEGINPYTELFYYPAVYKFIQDCIENLLENIEGEDKNYNYLRKQLKQELKAVFYDEVHPQLSKVYKNRKKEHGFENCVTNMQNAASYTRRGFLRIAGYYSKIEPDEFNCCRGLANIAVTGSGTMIGHCAFEFCTGLTGIRIIGNRTRIEKYAFSGCTNLTSIEISGNGTNIENDAFRDCKRLGNIRITGKRTKIAPGAFKGCTGITSIDIPATIVTKIDGSAFCGCTELSKLSVYYSHSKKPQYYSRNNCIIKVKTKELIVGCKASVVPSDGSVTKIGKRAFFGCTNLEDIDIPYKVTKIGNQAFEGCSELTKLKISGNRTKIGNEAFCDCTGLTNIEISGKGAKIGDKAFRGCVGLTKIDISKGVVRIGKGAFSCCPDLERLSYNSDSRDHSDNGKYHSNNNCIVDTKKKELIVGCKTSVIPSDGSVTKIGDYAFFGCSTLEGINIPDKVTKIGNSAFKGCTGLKNLIITGNGTAIGNEAFCDCTELKCAEIFGNGTSIGCETFAHTGLSGIKISGNGTEINMFAFRSCHLLKRIEITGNGTKIGDGAFQDCTGLENIEISSGLIRIGSWAFRGCYRIQTVYYHGSKEQWHNIDIKDGNECFTNAKIIFSHTNN